MMMNIALGVVLLGFLLVVWTSGMPSGPEGPVGAWIVPVPFLLILVVVLGVAIARGRFDWLPGGRPVATLLVIGFLTAAGTVLLMSFERESLLFKAIPFVMLAGCFWLTGGLRVIGVAGPAILVLASLGGYGLMGKWTVSSVRDSMAAAEQQIARERADAEAQSERALREFQALPPDAPLLQVIDMTFMENDMVQREVRARIANWPNRDEEIGKILSSETLHYTEIARVLSYIAYVHPAPPASLAPAYARAMTRSYTYWDNVVRNSYYASKSIPEMSTVIEGAERIQKAGGDLRPQLTSWYQLIKNARE